MLNATGSWLKQLFSDPNAQSLLSNWGSAIAGKNNNFVSNANTANQAYIQALATQKATAAQNEKDQAWKKTIIDLLTGANDPNNSNVQGVSMKDGTVTFKLNTGTPLTNPATANVEAQPQKLSTGNLNFNELFPLNRSSWQ